MYRWHKLSLLLLTVVMMGLAGCQSAIKMNDLSSGSHASLGEIEDRKDDKGSDFQIQMPSEWAVWQVLYLPPEQVPNFDSIDIVEWRFKTYLYPPRMIFRWN